MSVRNEERDYFRRIAEAKRRSHEEAERAHLAESLRERIRRSFELSLACMRGSARRDDDPSPFYDRARRLGLYKP